MTTEYSRLQSGLKSRPPLVDTIFFDSAPPVSLQIFWLDPNEHQHSRGWSPMQIVFVNVLLEITGMFFPSNEHSNLG